MTYRYIDLFAGCGGLSDGFEQTGDFSGIAHVEWDEAACSTLRERLFRRWKYADADRRVLRFDMQRTRELLEGSGDDQHRPPLEALVSEAGGLDLVIGGPPCQAYSVAGRIRDEHGMHNDYRNYLFESYVAILERFSPDVFLFENVPGMLSAAPGGVSITQRLHEAFEAAGYEIIRDLRRHAVIDVTAYGVPQRRRRVILVGLRNDRFSGDRQVLLRRFYDEMLRSAASEGASTVEEAIGDLPPFHPLPEPLARPRRSHGPADTGVPNHYPRYHNQRDIELFRRLAADIEDGHCELTSIDRIKQLYTEQTGRTASVHKYYVLRRNAPSNTIPAHLYKDGLRHIHPDPQQARSITVREAARLQSFDDDFEFLGSMGDQYKMIGNAVPPRFALALARATKGLLSCLSRGDLAHGDALRASVLSQ